MIGLMGILAWFGLTVILGAVIIGAGCFLSWLWNDDDRTGIWLFTVLIFAMTLSGFLIHLFGG